MKFIYTTLVFLCLSSFIVSCNPDKQEDEDRMLIEDYLEENNLQAEKTASGLYYIIHNPGNSEHPALTDNVHIDYRGTLLNGNQFDANPSATFPLGNLIDGMVEGIQLLGKGGEATLILPSALGYGSVVKSGIPANSVTIFEVTLIDF
ncbi:MAG TPA: FKBP-type peptidyl-prolyl cis-trans isomerase [Saprospiraceae bacterium]|nr:FKBP-type peptidyl-prolyl cis-trans isomerase [Saprospiraceae bacterium]